MELTAEVIVTGVAGVLIILGAIGRYVKSWNTAPPNGPVIAGVGLELGARIQIDQLIAAVNRIGDILENKKQSAMEEKLNDLTDMIDEMRRKA